MPSCATYFRYWLPLLALLGLGACQRASYSFQAPTSSAQRLAAFAPDSAVASASPAKPLLRPLAGQARRASRVAPRLARSLVRLSQLPMPGRQAVAAAHTRPVLATRQEPLPKASHAGWRTKGIALLLAFFLGGLGAHLFYLGYYGRGIAYLAGTLLGTLLVFSAIVAAFLTFSSGAGIIALLTIGAIITGLVSMLALIDTIRIAIGDLTPRNGSYFPDFFQTRDKP